MISDAQPDEEPWRACYQQLAPKLLLYARQWIPCAADAEDVIQTAFIRFWKRQPDASAEHYPLLYSAVRSAALDFLRTSERRVQRESAFHEEHATEEPYFDAPFGEMEEAERVQRALQQLPPEQRETLVLRIWGELSFAQIATALGESINTVAARHRYALEALRRILKRHEHERVGT